MAHFAEINDQNIVTRVLVVNNNELLDADGVEQEVLGSQFLEGITGWAVWKQTSYNNNLRKRFAAVGGSYDPTNDVFLEVKPYASWTLDSNYEWRPPITYPSDGNDLKIYFWDETLYQSDNSQGWVLTTASESDKP